MRTLTKTILLAGIILAVCHGLWGCKGGAVPELSGIRGPEVISEYETVEYWVPLVNVTGATFFWSWDPRDAGYLDEFYLPKTEFTASMATKDTPVKISVIVNDQQHEPVILTRDVTIRDKWWARTWGGGSTDYGNGIAVDGNGNSYITGSFRYTVDFNPGPGVDEHTSSGYVGIFLSKFDSNGVFQWAHTWDSNGYDSGRGIAVDGSSNVYITGNFYHTIDFDPGPGQDIHSSNGSGDIFLSKFDSNGEFQWTRTWGGYNYNRSVAIAVDGSGNVYTVGVFEDTVDFNPGPGVDEHGCNGDWDSFVSAFDANGEFLWARTWGGAGSDSAKGVAIDESGNAYITGGFRRTVDFDPGPGVDEHSSASLTSYDVFLSKFDSNGDFQWVRVWGENSHDIGIGVTIYESGSVYVTGLFYNTIDFDPGPGVDEHTSDGSRDTFLSKFDTYGEFQWARTWGGSCVDDGYGIAVDGSGNVYTVGRFQETVDFDPGNGVDEHISQKGDDIFLSMFDANGEFQWARTWGGAGYSESGNGVAIDVNGNVYTVGVFQKTVDFVPGHGVDEQTSHGDTDIFLCKFPPDWDW